MISCSRTVVGRAEPETEKPETIEAKIKELQKAMETAQKYRVNLLRSQADMVKQVDVAHMRSVLDLKKVIGYLDIARGKEGTAPK